MHQILHEETRMKLGMRKNIEYCARECNIKFKILPLYNIRNGNEQLRKSKESFFIKNMKSELNKFSLKHNNFTWRS